MSDAGTLVYGMKKVNCQKQLVTSQKVVSLAFAQKGRLRYVILVLNFYSTE